MSRYNEVGSHKTTIFEDLGFVNVMYHQTSVVRFGQGKVILNSGGWHSRTTKLRMNQTANQYGLGFSVYQRNFEWFVDFKGQTIPFEDHMVLEA